MKMKPRDLRAGDMVRCRYQFAAYNERIIAVRRSGRRWIVRTDHHDHNVASHAIFQSAEKE